jgi:hypothetical protein
MYWRCDSSLDVSICLWKFRPLIICTKNKESRAQRQDVCTMKSYVLGWAIVASYECMSWLSSGKRIYNTAAFSFPSSRSLYISFYIYTYLYIIIYFSFSLILYIFLPTVIYIRSRISSIYMWLVYKQTTGESGFDSRPREIFVSASHRPNQTVVLSPAVKKTGAWI